MIVKSNGSFPVNKKKVVGAFLFLNSLLKLTFILVSFASLMCQADIFKVSGGIIVYLVWRVQLNIWQQIFNYLSCSYLFCTETPWLFRGFLLAANRNCHCCCVAFLWLHRCLWLFFCGTPIVFPPAVCSPRVESSDTVDARPVMVKTRTVRVKADGARRLWRRCEQWHYTNVLSGTVAFWS